MEKASEHCHQTIVTKIVIILQQYFEMAFFDPQVA